MKNFLFIVLIITFGSCNVGDLEPKEDEIEAVLEIRNAPDSFILNTGSFLSDMANESLTSDSRFDFSNFSADELKEYKITYGEKSGSSFGILSDKNPEMALIIVFDFKGEILSAVFSESKDLPNNSVNSKFYDLSGTLGLNITTIGKEVVFHDIPTLPSGRMSGWFSDTWDCMVTAAQPLNNDFGNIVVNTAAIIISRGAYPIVLAGACAVITY